MNIKIDSIFERSLKTLLSILSVVFFYFPINMSFLHATNSQPKEILEPFFTILSLFLYFETLKNENNYIFRGTK